MKDEKLLILVVIIQYFILLVLKSINVVAIVKICVPDTVKNLNVKVFNLMALTNETRSIEWHESCKCICRLNEIICNNKHRWNKDKSKCECKKLIDKEVCDEGFIFNPSDCESECDKSYNIGQYLDY